MKKNYSVLLVLFLCVSLKIYAQDEFITTWKTDNSGTSNLTSITIPTFGSGYNYDVDWNNDGVFDETGLTGNITHDFGTPGIYTIQIRGTFPRIRFSNSHNSKKILSIEQWGTISWTSMNGSFRDCSNLVINTTDIPDLSGVNDVGSMFSGASSIGNGTGNWNWNMTAITDMDRMFFEAVSFNKNISSWNVGQVTDMENMFKDASSFNQNISTWNVANVIYMGNMFENAVSFDQNISNWDIRNLEYGDNMFKGVVLSTANYDALLIGWATDSSGTPNDGIDDIPTNIDFHGGFSGFCDGESARNTLTNATYNWGISDGGIVCEENMFITTWKTDNSGTSNLTSITIPTRGSGYNYDVDWDNDGVFDEIGLTGDVTHDFGTAGTYTIQIRGDFPQIRFSNSHNKKKILSIEQWGTNSWVSMNRAFSGCSNLVINATDIPDFTGAEDTNAMFFGASSIGNGTGNWNWNMSTITSMASMFDEAVSFNKDISTWDVSQVTDMEDMFNSATSFNQNLTTWNVSNVIYMGRMFENAVSFDQDISTWDISSLEYGDYMFDGVTLSIENYDALLIGWATDSSGTPNDDIDDIPTNIDFHGGLSNFCSSESARNILLNTHNWGIIDGGLDCSSLSANYQGLIALKLYPNPAKDIVFIEGLQSQATVKIYSISGKLMCDKIITKDKEIDISKFSAGIYLLKIQENENISINKLVIN